MVADSFGLGFCYHCGERCGIGVFDGLQASEVFEQAARCVRADAGDIEQFGGAVAHLAAFAMESDGEIGEPRRESSGPGEVQDCGDRERQGHFPVRRRR